jgi:hypothetical protein
LDGYRSAMSLLNADETEASLADSFFVHYNAESRP